MQENSPVFLFEGLLFLGLNARVLLLGVLELEPDRTAGLPEAVGETLELLVLSAEEAEALVD